MATKVKHETVKKIASMGQKEALRKYHAGEGDDEFKEAVRRYYSERRIQAAKPSGEARAETKREPPKEAPPQPSQAAVARKIGGPRKQIGPGQKPWVGKEKPIEKVVKGAVGAFATTGPKGQGHQARQTPAERFGETVKEKRKTFYKPGANVAASRAKAKESARDPLKEALKKRRK
jgi:hypothetical protein